MTRAIELQSDDGFRSSLSIRPSLDDAMGSRREFTRRFAEGIGKLAGSTLITDNNVNKMFDEMLMFGRVIRFLYIPCTTSSGLAVREIANAKDLVLMQELVHRRWSVRGHPKRWVFMCASELALDESLSHQYMGVVYYPGRSPNVSTNESYGGGRDHVNDQELLGASLRTAGELECFSAHIRLREPGKSEDKAEGGTSVESSIPCSHRGRALVVKGAEEVENAKTNSKYQDRVEGQGPRNFIRLVSMGFSLR
ncbi:hypothetical protein BHE74_00031029 [Ensete ventricosum]|nr:hypothetical protein BHE74_00031029 [Ensete ventricosum]